MPPDRVQSAGLLRPPSRPYLGGGAVTSVPASHGAPLRRPQSAGASSGKGARSGTRVWTTPAIPAPMTNVKRRSPFRPSQVVVRPFEAR